MRTMQPLIAIGCPVRNRAWVLPEYLAALDAIDHASRWFFFLENDSTDDTPRLIDEWIATRPGAVASGRHASPPGHRRVEYGCNGYAHLASVRNTFLELAFASGADYLLSVDSDVIVPPDLLERMLTLADPRTIVGAAISNIVGRPLDGRTCGNFLVREGGLLVHPQSYPLTGTLDVDVTGACVLIPRAAFEAGVRYAPHRQGEDIPFCEAARNAGFGVLVTFDSRPEHRMESPCSM